MKTVKYCDPFEARVICGRLENEGIQASVLNEHIPYLLPGSTGTPYAAAQVVVAGEDFDRAMESLAQDTAPPEDATRCPECGSEEIAYGFWRKKSGLKAVFCVAAAAFMLPLGSMRSRYTCKNCGHEYKP